MLRSNVSRLSLKLFSNIILVKVNSYCVTGHIGKFLFQLVGRQCICFVSIGMIIFIFGTVTIDELVCLQAMLVHFCFFDKVSMFFHLLA